MRSGTGPHRRNLSPNLEEPKCASVGLSSLSMYIDSERERDRYEILNIKHSPNGIIITKTLVTRLWKRLGGSSQKLFDGDKGHFARHECLICQIPFFTLNPRPTD